MSGSETKTVNALLQTAAQAFNDVVRMAAEQDLDVVLPTHRQGGEGERSAPIVTVRIRQRKLLGRAD
jgi:hypothetical protein